MSDGGVFAVKCLRETGWWMCVRKGCLWGTEEAGESEGLMLSQRKKEVFLGISRYLLGGKGFL